jgi:hypothetical protein
MRLGELALEAGCHLVCSTSSWAPVTKWVRRMVEHPDVRKIAFTGLDCRSASGSWPAAPTR